MDKATPKPEINREAFRRMAREAREELAALPPSRRPAPPSEPTAWLHRGDCSLDKSKAKIDHAPIRQLGHSDHSS
jgi:hypothetical protein